MNKKNKIVKNDLKELVSKYSKTNVLYLLENEYKSLPMKKVVVNDIDDNSFLKQIKFQKEDLSFLINAYLTNVPLEPLIVRQKKDHYEVVVGRKRLYAARAANIGELPVMVANYNDEEMLLILLAVARDEHHINPIEIAIICSSLSKKYKYSQESLARLAHQSRAQISSFIRILTLPDQIINMVLKNKIKYGHARALITLPENIAIDLANKVVKKGLTVRDVEKEARLYRGEKEDKRLKKLETKLNVKIVKTKKKISLEFENEADLAAFLEKMHD